MRQQWQVLWLKWHVCGQHMLTCVELIGIPMSSGGAQDFLVICIARKLRGLLRKACQSFLPIEGLAKVLFGLFMMPALYDIRMGGQKTFAATLMSQHSAMINQSPLRPLLDLFGNLFTIWPPEQMSSNAICIFSAYFINQNFCCLPKFPNSWATFDCLFRHLSTYLLSLFISHS